MSEFQVSFYDEDGREPFREFLASLDMTKRLALVAAIEEILSKQGVGVCRSSWGKQLGGGLFEFRVRHTAAEIRRMFGGDPPTTEEGNAAPRKVLLRAFCHAYGDKIVLLLGGYDKGADPSPRRQEEQIRLARKRLRAFQRGQRGSTGRRRES